MQVAQVPPLVFEIRHVGNCHVGASFGINISNLPFDEKLPMLFNNALSFIKGVCAANQKYWILRINSPGGCVENRCAVH